MKNVNFFFNQSYSYLLQIFISEFEANEKRRLEEELSDFEKELAADEKKERERNEKRMAGLSKRKEEMIKEKRQKQEVCILAV